MSGGQARQESPLLCGYVSFCHDTLACGSGVFDLICHRIVAVHFYALLRCWAFFACHTCMYLRV